MLLEELLSFAYQNSLTGLEFVAGIPGTVGGALRMNAGAHGKSFGDNVIETTYIDLKGNVSVFDKKSQKFGYRESVFESLDGIIVSTKINLNTGNLETIKEKIDEYRNQRKTKQCVGFPNAGSIFKRGDTYITAELIDKAGLKGYTVGGAKVSEVHSGFIVNTGNATAKDVLDVIEHVKQIVYEKFKVNLILEIIVLGD